MNDKNNDNSDVPSDVNNDELIQAQERQIEKEIADAIPLIGDLISINALQLEYSAEDQVYQQKVLDIQNQYRNCRKSRPDGNCFYRAFSFAYFESLLNDNAEYNRFEKIAEQSKDELIKQGFPKFTVEDFNETFMEALRKIVSGMTTEQLVFEIFNNQGISDYIVVYMRLITSGYLQKESEFFANFIEGNKSVVEFCKQEVEPMYKESDHIHITSLTSALNVSVRIIYMDRGDGGKVNSHDFGSSKIPRVHLLYRPGIQLTFYLKTRASNASNFEPNNLNIPLRLEIFSLLIKQDRNGHNI